MYGSYISGRMLNTFSYGSNFSQLPKRDNLHIKDKRPAPNFALFGSCTVLCVYIAGPDPGELQPPPPFHFCLHLVIILLCRILNVYFEKIQ